MNIEIVWQTDQGNTQVCKGSLKRELPIIMAKAYLGPFQIYMMELFAKIVNSKITSRSTNETNYLRKDGVKFAEDSLLKI